MKILWTVFYAYIFYIFKDVNAGNDVDGSYGGQINIARNKRVYMSSVYTSTEYGNSDPAFLTDGNRDSSWTGRSCAHTNDGPYGDNWMVVDLGQNYKITKVVAYNRLDCCSERESNLIIGLMTTFTPNQKIDRLSYPRCGVFPGSSLNVAILEINCASDVPQSRFVIAQLPAYSNGYLTICELEIMGNLVNRANALIGGNDGEINIARNKRVYMSSVYTSTEYGNSDPTFLTDGNRDSSWTGRSCAHTNDGPYGDNWMVVDLGQNYKITKVVAYNRLDCCSERESNLIIGLMTTFNPNQKIDRLSYPRCGVFPGSSLNVSILEINCTSDVPPSRFVIAQLPAYSNGYLTICELEIMGNLDNGGNADNGGNGGQINIARNKQVFMSSVFTSTEYGNSDPTYLTDGNRDSSWTGRSCAHTNDGPYGDNWMVVDLGQNYKVKKVVAYNRLDCCSERESNLIVGLMTAFLPNQKIDRSSYPRCGVFPGSSLNVAILEINCDSTVSPSRYVVLQQPAYSFGYLTVCELEVFA